MGAHTLNYIPLLCSVFKLKFISLYFAASCNYTYTSNNIFFSCSQNCWTECWTLL